MRNINRSLKIFSVLMFLTFVFSIAVFAEPDETVTPEPGEEITQTSIENVITTTESYIAVETTTSVVTTQETTSQTTVVSTTEQTTTTVENSEKKSNSNLKELIIYGIDENNEKNALDLSPSFKAEIKSYFAEVGKEYVTIEISAKAESKNAKVEIPEEIKLEQGDNIIKVVVTAEDDTKSVYEITVKYEGEEAITELLTAEVITQPGTLAASTPDYSEKSLNTYTKLGIVFTVGGTVLLGISVYLFFKKKK